MLDIILAIIVAVIAFMTLLLLFWWLDSEPISITLRVAAGCVIVIIIVGFGMVLPAIAMVGCVLAD